MMAPASCMMGSILSDLRAAVRPPAAQQPPAAAPAPQGLQVGAWQPPGSCAGSWGALAAPCGHPQEADALVAYQGRPCALLRRRWHLPSPQEIEPLPPVPLFELIGPHGRQLLSALAAEPLLDELLARLGGHAP